MDKEKENPTEAVITPLDGFAERLNQLRTHYQMGQRRFAEWLNLPPTTYHEYERKKRQPLLEAIVRILSRTRVSADWLLKGTGPMFPPDSPDKVLRDLREAAGLSEGELSRKADLPLERIRAFEEGGELPDLGADFPLLAEALGCDALTRQRLFDSIEREFRPIVYRSLVEASASEEGGSESQARKAKFFEPWPLRNLLDEDEECFRLYQAQPLSKKATLVMTILRQGIDDPAAIRELITDNFSEIRILDQVKALLASHRRSELISFIRFLLHRDDEAGEEEGKG